MSNSKRDYRPWTEADVTRLRELYEHHSLDEIAGLTGRTKRAVRSAASKAGLSCSKIRSGPGRGGYSPKWTEEDRRLLRENYATMPAPEIAARLGRTLSSLHVQASNLGLKSYHRKANTSLVPGYFRVIDTPMKAYLLGLLMADGWVAGNPRLQLGLALRDYDSELVKLLRDNLAPEARLSSYLTKEGNTMVKFQVGSADLMADLAQHGIVPRKSLVVEWPATVPPEHEGSFLCGMHDGDGSLELQPIPHWSLVGGSYGFQTTLQERVMLHTGVKVGGPYPDRRKDNCWRVAVTGKPVRALDAWMHRDVPGLARKRIPSAGQQVLF